MKPICVPCQRFYRPKKTGAAFVEAMPARTGNAAVPGTSDPEGWKPYKLWVGDLYRCEGCGAETIVGTSRGPVAEHYQPDFADKVERYGPIVQVNDC